jgi:hypothetical protein
LFGCNGMKAKNVDVVGFESTKARVQPVFDNRTRCHE